MSFHHFAQLPPELRQHIWRQCLPHRVVELDEPGHGQMSDILIEELDGSHECDLSLTTRLNLRPPIITRVSHESRAVSLEHAGFVHIPSGFGFGFSLQHFWMDRVRDVVHINWSWYYDDPWGGDPVAYWLNHAARSKGASLTDDLFGFFARSRSLRPDFRGISQLYVCILRMAIHADESSAIDSGLFGTLGEERIVLIDATDNALKRRYWAFNQDHGCSSDYQAATVFSEKYCSQDTWADQAVEEMKIELLYREWEQRPGGHANTEYKDFWEKQPADWEHRTWPASYRKHWVPNWQHNEVRRILDVLPTLHPTIMIRLCTDDCMKSRPGGYNGPVLCGAI